ncbi:MAG: DegT/DnrJ/EryC1/StrS family aminotransferase [Bacteroidetes bacterium]|nr:DegT/DnrJ/EryC1/StrS family aminotransferase [Bacteroidota bacterium]
MQFAPEQCRRHRFTSTSKKCIIRLSSLRNSHKKRDELQEHLTKNEIGTLIHYPLPPHLQKAYVELNYKKGDFQLSEEIAETCLSLPIYPGLSDENIECIVNSIKKFYNA